MTVKSVHFLGTCHTSVQKSVFRMRGFQSVGRNYDILNSVSMSLTQQELFWSVPGATKSGYINSFTCRSLYSSLQSQISDFVVLLKRHVTSCFNIPVKKLLGGLVTFSFDMATGCVLDRNAGIKVPFGMRTYCDWKSGRTSLKRLVSGRALVSSTS